MSLGRNDSCHCESGRKYKKCCLEKDNIKSSNSDFNSEITSLDKTMAEILPVNYSEERSPEYQALEDWVDVYLDKIDDAHPFRPYLEDGALNHITLLQLAKKNDWHDYYDTAKALYKTWVNSQL
jgi:hypothetical protein